MNDDEFIQFITDVEKSHFRTHQDTGANPNALIIWNIVRAKFGLPRLSVKDLAERAIIDYLGCAQRSRLKGDRCREARYTQAADNIRKQLEAGEVR